MRYLKDYLGRNIRLTDERLQHILEHPEMQSMTSKIEEILLYPEYVIESATDNETQLYYRFYSKTPVGNKWMCVVVKIKTDEAFVLTAYLTNKTKKGKLVWTNTKI